MPMKDLMNNDLSVLKEKKLYLLDMDGTIYLGNQLFPCTLPFLSRIKDKGGRYLFITNNSSKSVSSYVDKLHSLGLLDVTEKDFFTSSQASERLMKEKFGNDLLYVQGTVSFVKELKEFGLNVTEEYDDNAKAVLVGFDSELNMEKMIKTCKMLTFHPDIPYFATNPDWVCPTEWGYIPDCGSMCFSYNKATGRMPEFIGKPSSRMIDLAMKMTGYRKEDTVVIGDRLYTDIASGNHAGVTTICVLSGEVKKDEVLQATGAEKPTLLVDDLSSVF